MKQKSECMKHALQKVFFLSVLVMPTLFYAMAMNKSFVSENNFDSFIDVAHTSLIDRSLINRSFEALCDDDCSLPMLFRGELAVGGTGTFTIDKSGVYVLVGPKSAEAVVNIAITASDVVLDLDGNTLTGGTNGIEITGNNVTIKNGTITGATQSGIKIMGNNCLLQDITAIGNVTGFELNGAAGNTVRSCRALNNTREGFLLTNAQNTSFEQCEALNTSGAGTVAGFKTSGGTGNSFVECKINGVLSSNADAYGVLGSHEIQARISGSSVMNIAGSAYTAGIGLIGDSLATPTAHDFSYAESRNSRFPEWLNTGVGTYLAISNEGTPYNARIFQFSPTDGLLSVTTTQNIAGSCRQATWLSWHNKQYLAMVGNGTTGNDIFIYEFNLATHTLTTITSYNYATTSIAVFGCDWIVSGTLAYLAYVVYPNSGSGEELGVLRFDGSTLTKVSSLEYISTGLLSVKHHIYNGKIRLAVTQHPPAGRPDLIIHSFNEPQGSEALTTSTLGLVSYDLTGNEYIEKSAWFDFDGQTYLTFGIVGSVSTSNVRVVQYTENPMPTLTAVASFNYGGLVQDVDALVTGTTVYLAVGGAVAGQRTKILTFDPYAASADRIKSYYDCSADASSTAGVSWNRCPALDNKLFLAVSKAGANPRVYGFTLTNQSQLNLVNDNILSGVLSGDGVLLDFVTNTAQANTSYNCQKGFEASVRTSFPASEYAGELSNFVTSQVNSRGVYNIDTNLTTPDTVSLIADQVSTIESKVDVLYQDSFTIESKLDYLTACDYDPLPAPTTLSTAYGAYCLSADMSGDLAITGSGITLCLNGHTISGGTNGILVSGDEVVIKNGTVRNASASGIKITGDKCTLQDITAVGNVTGFEFNGADNTSINSCRAIDNTREGFLLTNAQKNNFEQCEAVNTSGVGTVAGFKTTGGMGNNFVDCKINGVTSSNADAYGLLGSYETQARIHDCMTMNVSGSAYTAGVALIGDFLGTPTVQDFVSNAAVPTFCIDWLNTPVGSYISSLGDSNAPERVDSFSPISGLTNIYSTAIFAPGYGRTCKWLTWNNSYYLMFSGYGSLTAADIRVFLYNPAVNSLTEIASYVAHTGAVALLSGDWVLSGTVPYLLYGGPALNSNGFGVLLFNGASLAKQFNSDLPIQVWAINSHLVQGKWRVAAAGNGKLFVCSFDDPQGSKTTAQLVNYTYDAGGSNLYRVSWLDYDGQTYLAFGPDTASASVTVLRYSELPIPTLTITAAYAYGSNIKGVDWLVTGTTVYLAVAGNATNKRTEILKFDPYQDQATRLSSYYVCSGENQSGFDVRWNRVLGTDDRVYLAVGKTGSSTTTPYLRVYGFDINNQSQLNMVSDCIVSGVPNGDGVLLDEITNAAYNNTAYNCQDGFMSAVRTNDSVPTFATSNRAVPG